MNTWFGKFTEMNKPERAWVRELVGKFGWNVRVAIQQVYLFGINRTWVYNYHTGELVKQA